MLPTGFIALVPHQAAVNAQDGVAWCAPDDRNRRDPLGQLRLQIGQQRRQRHAACHAGADFIQEVAFEAFEEGQFRLVGHEAVAGEHVVRCQTLDGGQGAQPARRTHQPLVHHRLAEHRKAAGHHRIARRHAAFLRQVDCQGVVGFRRAQRLQHQKLVAQIDFPHIRHRLVGQTRLRPQLKAARVEERLLPGGPRVHEFPRQGAGDEGGTGIPEDAVAGGVIPVIVRVDDPPQRLVGQLPHVRQQTPRHRRVHLRVDHRHGGVPQHHHAVHHVAEQVDARRHAFQPAVSAGGKGPLGWLS